MLKIFKKLPKKPTAIHPDYKKLVEKAFEIDGKEFYCFRTLADMPVNRYLDLGTFQEEAMYKMTHGLLSTFIEKMEEQLNGGKITKAIEILHEIKFRLNLKLEPDLIYRLASCVYFYIDEDLTMYDYDIGNEKIELFKKENLDSFFFKQPLTDLAPLSDISQQDMRDYSKMIQIRNEFMKKYLDIENL